MSPRPERRVMLAAGGLAALTVVLFGMEWRTLAALESKTAYAVRQDLRQAGEAVVRGMYGCLEAEARILDELDHQTLHHGASDDLAAAVERAAIRASAASSVFALVSCDCGDKRTSVERPHGGMPQAVTPKRDEEIRSASRQTHPLPNSHRRDLSIAPTPDGGLFVFSSAAPGVVIGFEVAGETWRGPIVAAAAKRAPQQPGQPEMEFRVVAQSDDDGAVSFGEALGGARLLAGYRGVTVAGLARKQFWMRLGMMTLVLGSIAFGVIFTLRGMQKETRFLAQMSHEMKTPLATIHLFAETLEMGRVASPEKRETYLRRIREEAGRLAEMIGDMLEVTRLGDRRKRFRMAAEDAEAIAAEALRDYEPWADARLSIEAGDLPPLRCDREAVGRALRNLLSNAAKYGAGGPVELRVGRSNGHVLFSVEDHGIGIAPNEQRRIFDRFYRIDDSKPGNGLGLAIAREIVQAHHGEIRVASEPGKGSTFTIALPASEAACQPS